VAKEAAKPAVEPTFDNMLHASKHAIGSIESSNNYRAVGPETPRGDRAYGKYQVMGANIPQWTQEVFGKAMTPEEFLANEKAQDAVFDAKFGSYLKKTGNAMDAASMWFTGRPAAKVPIGTKDSLGTTNPQYLDKFAKASGLAPQGVVPTSDSTPAPVAVPTGVGVVPAEAPSDDSMFGKAKDFLSNAMPSSPEGKLALLAGVFGMLASPNHYLLQAIGSGGLAGVQTYSDLIKLKNETLKNTMGMIQNRFTTVDGVHYVDRYTGQMITRDQYAAAVNGMMSSAGIGGVNMNIPGSARGIVESMPPTPGAPPSDTPVVSTAKEVLSTPPTAVPSSASVPPPTGAAGTPATTVAAPPQDANAVKAAILKDPTRWEGVPDAVNAPKLYSMADQAFAAANDFREKGRLAAPYNEAYSKNMYDQAENQMVIYKNYLDRAQKAVDDAAAQDVARLNKGVDTEFETMTVQPTVGGPTVVMKKSDALKAINEGKAVVAQQNPIETETMEVATTPTGPRRVQTKGNVIRDIVAGNPPVASFSPTQTDLENVPENPEDPTSNSVAVPKASLIEGANAGKPRVTAINPSRTAIREVQPDPMGPKVAVTDADVIKGSNVGKPVVTEQNPVVMDKLKQINTVTIPDMAKDNETRQSLINRVGTLSSIMEKYETGAWDTYKSAIVGQLRAAGFDVPQDAAADVQRIIKDSVKQVYDQAKQIGNKVLVAEIEGLSKTVPGVGLQPDANRALLAQMKGILNWEQKYNNDFMQYRKENPSDPNVEQWQSEWISKNPVKSFVKAAYNETAPKGMSMPPVEERQRNTRYNSKSKGILYWNPDTNKWSDAPVPEAP
jgi:hypothetical protein